MARKRGLRPYEEIRPDAPIRLADACEIVFDGAVTPAALRREAAKGNLVIERIAGKDFVTLAAIDAIRERCRVGGEGSRSADNIDTERAARRAKLASLCEQMSSRR